MKLELDHIQPRAEGGTDDIENAIPVCFECHAEIHSYNDNHGRGRKFRPAELRQHKEQWLNLIEARPDLLVHAQEREDVGPLQALVDELDFNLAVSQVRGVGQVGCPFLVNQFLRAVEAGSVAILQPSLKVKLIAAYRVMMKANSLVPRAAIGDPIDEVTHKANEVLIEAEVAISAAQSELLSFLKSEEPIEEEANLGAPESLSAEATAPNPFVRADS